MNILDFLILILFISGLASASQSREYGSGLVVKLIAGLSLFISVVYFLARLIA